MKRLRLFTQVAPLFLLSLLMTGCGQTYHLESIVITPTTSSIENLNGFASFIVTAQLSNGQFRDVTAKSTFSIAAPQDISQDGQLYMLSQMQLRQGAINQAQATGEVCTWTWIQNPDSSYLYRSDSFVITATFEGQTAQALISVNSSISNNCFDPSKPAPAGTPSGSGLPS